MENNILKIKIFFYYIFNESTHHRIFQIKTFVNDAFIVFCESITQKHIFSTHVSSFGNFGGKNVLNLAKNEVIVGCTKL